MESDISALFEEACEGPIKLNVSGVPRKAEATFKTEILTLNRKLTVLEIEVGNQTPQRRYTLTVTGTGCDKVKTVDIILTVGPSQMSFIKRQSKSSIQPGAEQTYTLTITNKAKIKAKGEVRATGIIVTDTLDANLTYINDTSGVAHKVNGRTHTWYFKRHLDPNEFITFNINTRMADNLMAGVTIANTAFLDTDQLIEPLQSNRVVADSDFTAVGPEGLRISKRVSRRRARIGKILVYRVDIENISNGTIFNLQLEDLLPNGFKLIKNKVLRDGKRFDNPQGRRRLRWNLGTLQGKSTTRLRYQVVVGTNARRGRNTNTAIAKGTDGGGNKVRAEAKAMVQLGIAGVLELGQIKATVFLDNNDDRLFNAGDKKLPEIGVLMATGEKRGTDENGEALFEEITPGRHVVALDERTLPDGYALIGESSRLVNVLEAEHAEVEFPVKPPLSGSAAGRVYLDVNSNGRYDQGIDFPIPGVTVKIRSDIKTTVTDANGYYRFDNMEPGGHVVWIDPQTLPAPYRPLDNQPVIKIVVYPGGVASSAVADFVVLKAVIYEEGVVEGVVCLDLNGNGDCEQDEPGIVGVTVYDPPQLEVVVNQIDPDGNNIDNTPLNLCEDITFRVTITNNGDETAADVDITNSMPDGFTETPQNSNDYTIPAEGTVTAEFFYSSDCSVVSGDNETVVSFTGYPDIRYTRSFIVNPGAITLTKVATHVNGLAITETSEPAAQIGDIITWRIRVESSGLGDVRNVEVTESLGDGLIYTDTPPPIPLYDKTSHPALANIAPNDFVDITVNTTVDGCIELTNDVSATWGCDDDNDCLEDDVTAQTSVNLYNKHPYLEYSLPDINIDVPYCSPTAVSQSRQWTIENTGDGFAQNVSIAVDFTPFDISVTSSVNPDNVTYVIPPAPAPPYFNIPGIIDPGDTVTINYDVTYNVPAVWCTAGESSSGTHSWGPTYQDECGIFFYPPIKTSTYSIDMSGQPQPSISVTKTCTIDGQNISPILPISDAPQTVICNVAITYSGPTTCGDGGTTSDLAVNDNYPDEWTLNSVTPTGGTPDPSISSPFDDPVDWTIPGSGLSDGTTFTYEQSFTIPAIGDTDVCASCGTPRENSLSVSVTDCCDCPLNDSASVLTHIECPNPAEIGLSSSRTIEPTGAEVCQDVFRFNHPDNDPSGNPSVYAFEGAGWNNIPWADNVRFTEEPENDLELVGTSLITVTLANGTTCTPSVLNPPPGLIIDFNGSGTCPANIGDGTTLRIQYDLRPTTDSEPQCEASHSFVDFAALEIIDASAGNFSGDFCSGGGNNSFVIRNANELTTLGSSMTVDISGMDAVIGPCGEYTPTITITKTSDEPAYDAILILDTTNYAVVEVTDSSGLIPPDGQDGTPVTGGGGHEWNYGDLFDGASGQTATLKLLVQKKCADETELSAILRYKDGCDDGDPCEATASVNGMMRKPLLSVTKFPEVVYADSIQGQPGYQPAEWTVEVVNSGAGEAYNVEVIETLGGDMRYNSHSWNSTTGITPYIGTTPDGSALNGASFVIDELVPGEKRILTFRADLIGCETSVNTVEARVHCLGETCQSVTDTAKVSFPPTDLVVSSQFSNPLNLCAIESVVITARNAGLTPINEIVLSEQLPTGLNYRAGTSEYRINPPDSNNLDTPAWQKQEGLLYPEPTGVNPYNWSYETTYPAALDNALTSLAPGEIIQIRFSVSVFCTFEGGQLISSGSFNECTEDGGTETSKSIFNVIPNEPVVTITKSPEQQEITCNSTVEWTIRIANAATGTAGQAVPAQYLWIEDTFGGGFDPTSVTLVGINGTPTPITEMQDLYPVPTTDGINDTIVWELFDLNAAETLEYELTANFANCGSKLDNNLIARVRCIAPDTAPDPDDPPTEDDEGCVIPPGPSANAGATHYPAVIGVFTAIDLDACAENVDVTIELQNPSTLGETLHNLDVAIELPAGVTLNGTTATIFDADSIASEVTPEITAGPPVALQFLDNEPNSNNLPEIPAGESILIRFNVDVDCNPSGQFRVKPSFRDCCNADITLEMIDIPTNLLIPNIEVEKTNVGGPYDCGDTVTWEIVVTNVDTGNNDVADAEMIRVTDTYGIGLTFNDFYEYPSNDHPTINPTTPGGPGGSFTWEIPSLAAGASMTYRLETALGSAAACTGNNRQNQVDSTWHCVTGTAANGDPNNDESTCDSAVVSDDTLANVTPVVNVNASVSPNEIEYCTLGRTVRVDIAIPPPPTSNIVYNLDATISLPTGLEYHSGGNFNIETISGSVTGLAVTASNEPTEGADSFSFDNGSGHLATSVSPGSTIRIEFDVKSSCFDGGDIGVQLALEDCCENQPPLDQINTHVDPAYPNLNVNITKSPDPANCGDNNVKYTITVTNSSDTDTVVTATYARIAAQLGEWLSYQSSTTPTMSGGNSSDPMCDTDGAVGTVPVDCVNCTDGFSDGFVVWDIENLPPEGTWQTVMTVAFNKPADFDCDDVDRELTVTTQYGCPPDLNGWTMDTDACSDDNAACLEDSGSATNLNGLPDLAVAAITPNLSCTASGEFGGNITVTIENRGDGPAQSSFTVEATKSEPTPIWTGSATYTGIPSIAPGASVDIDIPATGLAGDCLSCTSYRFDAEVDRVGAVCECDEDNNSAGPATITPCASIGDYVWIDVNHDGIQNEGAGAGLEGVTVNLLSSDGTVLATTTTDASGHYVFTNLLPGDYAIEFIKPAGYVSSPKDQGGDDAGDSDADQFSGRTPVTHLDPGENDMTWDAGFYQENINPLASIGDLAWHDLNADGIQDAGEPGIEGVTVRLYESDGTPVGTTTTDANGNYLFDNLPVGDYYLEFEHPGGYTVSPQDQGGNDARDSDVDPVTKKTTVTHLDPGENDLTWDAGYYNESGASVGDYVWFDLNEDGVQDPDELPIPEVKLNLYDENNNLIGTTTTDANGKYLFDNLGPGNYSIEVDTATLPEGLHTTYDLDGGLDNRTSFFLSSDEHKRDVDFGYAGQGAIGDTVWVDQDGDGVQGPEEGIPNTTVTLTGDVNGDGIIDTLTTTTDADGKYLFDNLPPGDYSVTIDATTLPNGMVQTYDADGVLDNTSSLTLGDGEKNLDQDFGYKHTGAIGDTLWMDLDGDGVQDANEPPIAGVTVNLYDAAGNVIGTAVTDANGKYLFDELPPGDYTVKVDTSTLPPGLAQTYDADGGLDSQSSLTLGPGEQNLDQDFGYNYDGAIGDTVWLDLDGDGVQDAGETGISGVTINLYDGDGNLVGTVATDSDGKYLFDELPPGDYTVKVDTSTLPPGLAQTYDADGGLDAQSSLTLAPGEQNLDQDFGYNYDGAIGDTLWMDLDGDGVQDANEPPIAGVTVNLYDAAGNVIGTAVTDSDGKYLFDHLPPGDYTVKVDTFTLPPGLAQTYDADGGLDAQSSLTLAPGEQNLDQDFGYNYDGAIGDTVWLDLDGDGVQDAGEAGISGVTINLYDGDGNLVGTAATDSDGKYLFDELPPGDYTVKVDTSTLPPGLAQTYDADGGLDAQSSLTLASGEQNLDQDFGYNYDGAIGDTVWLDLDGDGVQDAGEAGIPGVTINLYDGDGNLVGTVATDSDGKYLFDELPPGDYTVKVDTSTLPPGLAQTYDADGGLDSQSSLTLGPGEQNLDQDFGYQPPSGSIGDTIWSDTNGNGVQDAGEPGIPGVTVYLYDGSGNLVDTQVTDANGHYLFTDLPAGDYTIKVDIATLPPGLVQTYDDAGDLDSQSSLTLCAGCVNLDQDFGYQSPLGSIGDTVWLDTDANGAQDAGEPGISGVTVYLYDGAGNLIATTVTDANGHYLFTDLPAGDYTVKVDISTLPPGLAQTYDADGGLDSQSSLTLCAGCTNLDQDFGYTPLEIETPVVDIDDFDIRKIATPTIASPGDTLLFTLQLVNNSDVDIEGVKVTDELPDGFSYVSGSSVFNGGAVSDPLGGQTLDWTLDLKANQTATLTYKVLLASDLQAGNYRNVALMTVPTLTTLPPGEEITVGPVSALVSVLTGRTDCCLTIEKEHVRRPKPPAIIPVDQDIYFITDMAMFASFEFDELNRKLDSLLQSDQMFLTTEERLKAEYLRITRKAGRHAHFNLGSLTMQSGLGLGMHWAADILAEAAQHNIAPQDVVQVRLNLLAKRAGLQTTPQIKPLLLEYYGGAPYYAHDTAKGDLRWNKDDILTELTPSALGMTLLRQSTALPELLSSRNPYERFIGEVTLWQMNQKVKLIHDQLVSRGISSDEIPYLPHELKMEKPANTEKFTTPVFVVQDTSSHLFDQTAMLWGLSSMRRALKQAGVKSAPELDALIAIVWQTLETFHFDQDLKTYYPVRQPFQQASKNIKTHTLSAVADSPFGLNASLATGLGLKISYSTFAQAALRLPSLDVLTAVAKQALQPYYVAYQSAFLTVAQAETNNPDRQPAETGQPDKKSFDLTGQPDKKAFDLMMTTLALDSFADETPAEILSADVRKRLDSQINFLKDNLIDDADGGVFAGYNLAKKAPITAAKDLLSQAAAIRMLLAAKEISGLSALFGEKNFDTALKIYQFMEVNLWDDKYGIYRDNMHWRLQSEYTPLNVGATVGALRELSLRLPEEKRHKVWNRICVFLKRVVGKAELQLEEDRDLAADETAAMYVDESVNSGGRRPMPVTRRRAADDSTMVKSKGNLAPVLIRKVIFNLIPQDVAVLKQLLASIETRADKEALESADFHTPAFLPAVIKQRQFDTGSGMLASNELEKASRRLLKDAIITDNAYLFDPTHVKHFATVLDEIAYSNRLRLSFHFKQGVPLKFSAPVTAMAQAKGGDRDEALAKWMTQAASQAKLERVPSIADPIFAEYKNGEPAQRKNIESGWNARAVDHVVSAAGLAQTMNSQLNLIKNSRLEIKEQHKAALNRYLARIMGLQTAARVDFIEKAFQSAHKQGIAFLPADFEIVVDSDGMPLDIKFDNPQSTLFSQISLLQALGGLTALDKEAASQIPDYDKIKNRAELLTSKVWKHIQKTYLDSETHALSAQGVTALDAGLTLVMLGELYRELPDSAALKKPLKELLQHQAKFVADQMVQSTGDALAAYGTPDVEKKDKDSLASHSAILLGLIRVLNITDRPIAMKKIMELYHHLENNLWDERLGVYLSHQEHSYLSRFQYTDLDLALTISALSEMLPLLAEQSERHRTANRLAEFGNRLLVRQNSESDKPSEPVGKVVTLKGKVTAESTNGTRVLKSGSPVYQQDVLVTYPDSRSEVRFEDGTRLAQGPDSRISVDEYVFDKHNDSTSGLVLNMFKGVFRVISGKIAEQNPDRFTVKSPLATIGIRGTATVSNVQPGLEKHGVQDMTQGKQVVIQDKSGNKGYIDKALMIIEFYPNQAMSKAIALSKDEMSFYLTNAPFTDESQTKIKPEPDYNMFKKPVVGMQKATWDVKSYDPEIVQGVEILLSDQNKSSGGDLYTYVITVKNICPDQVTLRGPLYDLLVRDQLPEGMTYISGSSKLNGQNNFEPSQIGQNLTWKITQLENSEQAVITFKALVDQSRRKGEYINKVNVSGWSGGEAENRRGRCAYGDEDDLKIEAGLGKIQGRVFMDRDENGQFNAAEKPIAGIRFKLDGTQYATTDKGGIFVFDNLEPGFYRINADWSSVKSELLATTDFITSVQVKKRTTTRLKFGFNQYKQVHTQVYDDLNNNGKRDTGEPGVHAVRVNIRDTDYQAYSAEDGHIRIDRVPVGVREDLVISAQQPYLIKAQGQNLQLGPWKQK
ncbi:SdrD B-like domain-containing protein [Desulfococcaceae bacterium HSG9]|nr:SdrD B-like domain-containing protein [Desulfococcaceae bacterium HSG9]